VLKGLHDGILGLELLISQGMNAAQSHPQNFAFFELMKKGADAAAVVIEEDRKAFEVTRMAASATHCRGTILTTLKKI